MKILNFKMNIKRAGEEGFTLLEVLIALTILGIGLLMLAGFQFTAIKANGIGYKMSEGVVITQDEMEQLKNLSSTDPSLSIGSHTLSSVTYNTNGLTYARGYVVTQNPDGVTLSVAMTTSWTDDRGPHTVNMTMFH